MARAGGVQDYRWWWRSILNAGSTGLYVFAYAVFFYFKRSSMSGVIQTAQFFGYTLLLCYCLFLGLGAIGFYASLRFVRYLFKQLKAD